MGSGRKDSLIISQGASGVQPDIPLSFFPDYPLVAELRNTFSPRGRPSACICCRPLPFRESGLHRSPTPVEKLFPRREEKFVRKQADADDDEHDANHLVHGI